ncbi:MAG: hypothetical protein K2W96_16440 [Gemmataceae bacterium]|nr:hypothetical protein [Gemmataceae bacterium]
MSAGFEVGGEVSWGTNGAVEAYLEAMAEEAAARSGPADPLAAFLREEREAFSMGKVVFLDDWLGDAAARARFVELLDAATNRLRDGFTDYGREWMATVVRDLRERIGGP